MDEYKQFEKNVAQLFRDLGAEVQHNIDIGGNQIDVLATFNIVRIPINIAVECKHYKSNVGIDIVNKFIGLIDVLRGRPGNNKIDRGLIISKVGFTTQAKRAASEHPIELLTIDDIVSYIARINTDESSGSFGSESYLMIEAMNGINLDEKRSMFWRLFNSVCKTRKWSPEVEQNTLRDKVHTCTELAKSLDNVHRSAAYMLEGMIYYDMQLFPTAAEKFSHALTIAKSHALKPASLQAQFWQARCRAEQGEFGRAIELLEDVWKESRLDAALANFTAKVEYWRAKVFWIAHKKGIAFLPIEEIKSLFRDLFNLSDKLGIINYREGARARLAEIFIEEGNHVLALEELLTSYELTPNAQDRRKLEQLIIKAHSRVPKEQRQNIEERVQREVIPLRWADIPAQPPDVQVCDYAVWRFAKFKRDRILQHINNVDGKWMTGIRSLLEDDELLNYCIEADHKRDHGLTQQPYTEILKYRSLRTKLRANGPIITKSDLKHHLRMCRRLFFSSVLINDSGKKGSLSLVPLCSESENKILEKRDSNFVLGNNRSFSCTITTRNRLSLSEDIKNSIRKATSQLAVKVFERAPTRGVFPISIDFLISGDRFYLLEFHYPSRGFVVLYEAFRDFAPGAVFPVDIYAKQIDEFARELGLTSILLGHNDLFQDDSKRPRSEFYTYEFEHIADSVVHQVRSAKIEICNDWNGTSRKHGLVHYGEFAPEVVILDDIDPNNPILGTSAQIVLPNSDLIQVSNDRLAIKNLCTELEIPIPPSTELRHNSLVDFEMLRDMLGELIVVKERFHLPSWHEEKRRCEFLDLTESADKARLTRWVEKRELLAEKIITTSVDNQGHCGELRVHACVMV